MFYRDLEGECTYSLEKASLFTLIVFQKTLLAVYCQLQEFD